MAIKAESFLVLEDSLSVRLSNAWKRSVSPILTQITKAVREGDFKLASDLVFEIDMMPTVERQKKFIDLIGMGSALYGAAQLTPPRDSSLNRKTIPDEVKQARNALIQMIGIEGTKQAQMAAQREIAAEELRQNQTAGAIKAEEVPFVRGFPTVVKKAGAQMVTVGSSLHTSRLANWGFAVEADVENVNFYEVSEQLDGRTCPVCRIMDGKTFPVTSALNKLEGQLAVIDPNALKALAAWPRQDPASVAALSAMTTEQLIARGWDTPPFHPLCRGIMVRTPNVIEPDEFDRPQVTAADTAFIDSILRPEKATPGGAVVLSTSDTGERPD